MQCRTEHRKQWNRYIQYEDKYNGRSFVDLIRVEIRQGRSQAGERRWM